VKIGMVGLGRMGGGMTERLTRAGHTVQTFDPNWRSSSSRPAPSG
jgi:3-hydroxyisobutyrate dehydrogenase-like beta-hydroxyacid dehydrogenase